MGGEGEGAHEEEAAKEGETANEEEDEEEEEEEYSEWVLYKNSTGSQPYRIKFEEPIQLEEEPADGEAEGAKDEEDPGAESDGDGASEASEKSSSYAISSATDPDSAGPKKELEPRYGCWTLIYDTSRMRDQLLLKDLVQTVEPWRVVIEVDSLERSPLILAALNERDPRKGLCGCELAKPIMRASAKVDHKDSSGTTALMYAAARGDYQMVTVLLEGNADADQRNRDGQSAFDFARNATMRGLLVRKMVERRIQPSKASEALVEALEAAAKMKEEEKEARSEHYILRIEGLPRVGDGEAVERVLRDMLKKKGAGRPKRVELVSDPITQIPTGLAYVDYHHIRLAEAVMAADGEKIEQSVIRVSREA